ncbi:DUF4180 domain-containing protein [Sphingobacterium daejeonense]|uniref:DUF4180 domain-containing protein n=1 Tax=Sphingobacterium daejeonense TaxID=371142 RepID=UPI0021A5CDFD|nr:DUF4180 domain-containing protein [Sphingobacterium daejeonense]MCT1529981.1 DUF4180 domain-containing protein [Sphingobacterium daejeonense]
MITQRDLLSLVKNYTAKSMEIIKHTTNNQPVAEIIADDYIWTTIEDGKDIMGDIYYQGYDKLIVHEKNIHPDFFDLKTKIAGEILQKFSTYRVRLVIVGNFSTYESRSLKDFIFESNKGKAVNFLSSLEEALAKLSQ